MRLDKYLKETGYGSRSEVKKIIKKKRVSVNGKIINDESYGLNELEDEVKVDNVVCHYQKYVYIMLNKPSGVITSVKDNYQQTVMDLINDYNYKDLFPVGRLDIDSVGLLLITNDGALAHDLLSPKHHVEKTYFIKTNIPLTIDNFKTIENGIKLDDKIIQNAKIIEYMDGYLITIHEGIFHQIKRMIKALDKEVIFLKRISMGTLTLDETLAYGAYRSLTENEINALKCINNKL